MIDRTENMKSVRSIVSEFVSARTPGIMVIFGDYGMGKSFTLKKLLEDSAESNWAGAGTRLFPIFLKAIEPEQKGAYLSNLFMRIMLETGPEGIKKLAAQSNGKVSGKNTVLGIMNQVLDEDSLAYNWLVGRRLSNAELRTLGIRFTPSDYAEIRPIFLDFLEVLKSGGRDSLVLLLDKWEFLIAVVGRTKLWKIVREIQRLYDTFNEKDPDWQSHHATIITVLATSAGAWYRFLEVAREISEKTGGGTTETFLRRIATKGRVELVPLKEDFVKQLLTLRMKEYQTDKGSGRIFPFSDDYYRMISRVSHGIPSRVLSYSALVLSEAVKNRELKISAEFGERVLRNYRLWEDLVPATTSKDR